MGERCLRCDEFDHCSEGCVRREYFELLEDSIMLIFADIFDCSAGNTDGSESSGVTHK